MDEAQIVSEIRRLIEGLVTTPGPTGAEQPRLAALEKWTAKARLATRRDEAGNLWINVCGDGPWDQTLLLDAHVDVVGRGYAERVVEEDGRLIGAGVTDNLSAVAMLALFAREVRTGRITPPRPVQIVYTVGEEGLGNLRGIRQVTDDHPTPPHLLISLDGARHKCHVAGLGSNRYRLTFTGAGGHSWSAYGTPSATEELIVAIGEIRRLHRRAADEAEQVISFNLGTLAGGEGINCISRNAEATFEFRSADPDALTRLDEAVHAAILRSERPEGVRATLEIIGKRPAARRIRNESAEETIRRVWGRHECELTTTVASTNINVPLSRGWPAVCVGLITGGNGHRQDEFIELDSLAPGWRLLTDLVEEASAAPIESPGD